VADFASKLANAGTVRGVLTLAGKLDELEIGCRQIAELPYLDPISAAAPPDNILSLRQQEKECRVHKATALLESRLRFDRR